MQEQLDAFTKQGATVVALTPQKAEHNLEMVDTHELGFDLLSDPGNAYAHQLGMRFELPDELRGIYQSFGIDLPACNGEASWTLPMPGRIVVGANGVVTDVDADPDYTIRPEPETTLDAVTRLTG